MNHYKLGVLMAIWVSSPISATELKSLAQDRQDLKLTIYNQNRALVEEKRLVKLPPGLSGLQFEDVSALIDPSSLILKSNGDLRILEQNYEYDLINSEKLLEKYLGQSLQVVMDQAPNQSPKIVNAKLLAYSPTPVFEIDGQIHLGLPGRVILPKLPDHLAIRPSLNWMVQSAQGGDQNIDVSYLTTGLSWSANYVLAVDTNDQRAHLNGWITLQNQSGTGFENAKLKLVAGDVNQIQESRPMMLYKASSPAFEDGVGGAVQEKSFDEYHLYTVPRLVTVANEQSKQIELFGSTEIGVQKVYRAMARNMYFFGSNNGSTKVPVAVQLEFKTGKANHLDLALPAGLIRVYKRDGDGSQIFVGEDRISHTPKDERVSIKTGDAFDIVTEYHQTEYQQENANSFKTSWEVHIRNHKAEKVVVNFEQNVWGDWSVISGPQSSKLNANTLRFPVEVKPDSEAVLRYTIRVKR